MKSHHPTTITAAPVPRSHIASRGPAWLFLCLASTWTMACSSGLPSDKQTSDAGSTVGGSKSSGGTSSATGGKSSVANSTGGASSSGGTASTGGNSASSAATTSAGNSSVGGASSSQTTSTAAGAPSTGGVANTGGASASSAATATGGRAPAGGTSSTGGASTSGPIGGAPASGGKSSTGGASTSTPTGGAAHSGGTSSTGGAVATGGAVPTGGVAPTGGAPATGGATDTGGTLSTGGAPATGGTAQSTGGAPATGGTTPDTGGSPATGGTTQSTGGNSGQACIEGDLCTPANSCHVWTTTCTNGVQSCQDSDLSVQNGTPCGTNQVCNLGSCVTCASGVGCTPSDPDPCGVGTTSCTLGVSTCQISGPAAGQPGKACGMSDSGTCSAEGHCVCPSGQAYAQGDCQVCPAFTQAVAYVNADPTIGTDNACCGRVQQKGFGGPCLTVGQAIEVAAQNSTISVTGDALGNASALEQYPIRLRKGANVTSNSSAGVCFRGASSVPVFAAQDDTVAASLQQVVIGTTCQGDPGGASDAVYVGKTASGVGANLVLTGTVVIQRVDNGMHVVVGTLSVNSCSANITNVTNGILLDGGSIGVLASNVSVAKASNAGFLCQSQTDLQALSEFSISSAGWNESGLALTDTVNFGIFAGTGCRITSAGWAPVGVGTMSGACPSPKIGRFGIYAEGDAQVSVSGSTIRCMSEDGISLRANSGLSVNAPQVSFSGGLEHNGCTGAYAEVGRLTVFGSSVMYNHTGVVQRSPQSSTDASSAVVNLAGTNNGSSAMNTFKCNGKAEPGLCCNGTNCPNGFDVWNNSGLPLDASSNYWRAAPVAQCICNEQLQSCTCSGSAYGQTTPPDGLSVLRSPFQGSNTGTVNIAGYALVPDPTCPDQ